MVITRDPLTNCAWKQTYPDGSKAEQPHVTS